MSLHKSNFFSNKNVERLGNNNPIIYFIFTVGFHNRYFSLENLNISVIPNLIHPAGDW